MGVRSVAIRAMPEPAERVVLNTTTPPATVSSRTSEMRRERRVRKMLRVLGIAIGSTSFRVGGPLVEPLRRR